jgi:hypothetical protein
MKGILAALTWPVAGLLLLSAAVEGVALAVFATEPAPARAVLSFLALHALATAVGAHGLRRGLPVPLARQRLRALVFFAALLFFIPVLGLPAITFGLLLPMIVPRREIPESTISATPIPDLPYRALIVTSQPIYGALGLMGVIRHGADPSARVRAVMATRQLSSKLAIPILRVALRDPVDDVRLLAYALLDSKERTIYSDIKGVSARLASEAKAGHGALHRRLAQEYWELVYLGLAQGEVLTHVITKGLEHAGVAAEALTDDAGLRLLQGRLLLAAGKLEEAQETFQRAQALGLPRERVLPYMAELAFDARRFSEVQVLLREVSTEAKSRMPLAPLIDYWEAR